MFNMEYKSSPNVYFIQVNILASAGTVSAREAPAEAFYSCAVSSRLLARRDGGSWVFDVSVRLSRYLGSNYCTVLW